MKHQTELYVSVYEDKQKQTNIILLVRTVRRVESDPPGGGFSSNTENTQRENVIVALKERNIGDLSIGDS